MAFQYGSGLAILLHEIGQVLYVAVAVRLDHSAVEVELDVQLDAHRRSSGLRFRLGLRHRLDRFNDRHGFLFHAVGPTIGRCDATTDQRTPTSVAAAFDGPQRGTGHATYGCTGRPVLLLHACTTCQERGHDNNGYCCP